MSSRFWFTLSAILLALSIACETARADAVLLGGVSYHITSDDTTNSFHRAVMYTDGEYLAGYARNSYDQDSFVIGYKLFSKPTRYFDFDIYGGAVRGYDKCYGKSKGKKVLACALGILNWHIKTDTQVQPTVSLWGDALVGTARIEF